LNKWKQVIDEEGVEVKLNPKQLTELTTNEFFKIIKEVPLDIRDGFWELAYELKEIKKLKIGLVTNTDRMTTMQVLKEIGVSNTFDLVVCGDDVKNPKPDPEIYKLAAKKLNLNSRDILVFEDSVPGAEAAVKAGMEVIVIWDQTTARGAYPQKIDVFVPDFLPFPGNLDLDFMDKFNNVRREYEEFKKSKGQSKP
jgi:HAD superfamily hydrolase (TIGR01509 family)